MPGTQIESDERKSCFWLGSTTATTKYDPMRLVLHARSTANNSKTFEDKETSTHANKAEGQNSALKGPCKKMKGVPKRSILEHLD